jgi:hypothetical protein
MKLDIAKKNVVGKVSRYVFLTSKDARRNKFH